MFVPQQYFRILLCLVAIVLVGYVNAGAQITGRSVYDQIGAFTLGGGKAEVTNLVLKRDRVSMTFNGTLYFSTPVGGQVTGAVFIGTGVFSAEMPPSEFEKANVRRLLKADKVASTFTSAVLRFSDNTFDLIGKGITAASAPPQAQKLATEFEQRMLKETGANIASRLTLSFLNGENPGVFIGTFEGDDRDRFSYVFDPYGRIPTATFDVNGGEKGLVFSYKPSISDSEIWTAFYGLDDYARNSVTYSDQSDLVDISHYSMQIDLRTPKSKLGLRTKITMQARVGGVRAIPFTIGESLDETDDARLKKQLRLKEARLGSTKLETVQEDWEGGFTVFLPEALQKEQTIDLEFDLEGDFMRQAETVADCSYPRSNESWYPRHGYLDRATYDFTFLHAKRLKVASVGMRESETPFAEDKDVTVTKYKMSEPIALATFALGPWERHADTLKWEGSEKTTPLEFNSVPGSYRQIKEDFILAELSNSVRFFNLMFGAYPYQSYSATFHPYGFGQGFPSMLMIPDTDRANKYTYSFISHETAHQWWGNIVAWRSYRDQWLSEGFAEYSGVLYTQQRQNAKAANNLVDEMRASLKNPPMTLTGPGKGRLVDVGPLILGHRLSTSKTFGGYQTLVYNKGALVLRMLHFLMTDPNSGNGQAFFDMMKDFVERYRNQAASTDDFRMVANEHFARSPIGKKYKLNDLNWFFDQWVYQTSLPSYTLEYQIENQPDGSVIVSGNVLQEDAPENWFMPLPLAFGFGGDKNASGTIHAFGPKTPFKIKLPMKPTKVELDPNHWILSDKTTTK